MNMPPPIRAHSYDEASNKIRDAAEKVAKSSMIAAASDVKATDGKGIGVTVDGTWQRRGFSSLNGIVAAIAVTNGNVLDVEVMSRQYKSCLKNAPQKDSDPEQYKIWRAGYYLTCNLNYVGPAPNMECTGAVKMFEHSLQKYGLRYLKYYGDGDSKGFNAVESIYEGVKVARVHRTLPKACRQD